MRILGALLITVVMLTGCTYQSGYINNDGAWIAQGIPYALGTCRTAAAYVIGPAGPAGPPGPAGPAGPAGPRSLGDSPMWWSLENVHFKPFSAELQPNCKHKIAVLAAWIQNNNPKALIALDGHQATADDSDRILAAQRVTAVRDALVA